ncbi:complex I 24 kDa subunit family protein [Sinanaerobacter chloroacetimidivorans]|uniref:NAD(P)H-dependent oxidoreductase subunit E n=1 Tax=Sinanaerobacter chloroacetimidivorans TaxID=2818044 RepID=A0A8J7VZB5_9FIRM|nr:NAD(P)H-dependent oxidoreductase subunit E [Sinanaerobacter chloroacetimidivorans]MBR0597441.1 NAD(P)H-dependent oxidoreductase subunit E [Sinanaerobacter chloroacetimidivorans]
MNSKNTKSFGVLTEDLALKIDTIITNYQSNSTKLVGILLDIQDIVPKQYIPREVASYVSEKMNMPLSKIYDVISFYAALSDVPRADYVIQLCDSVVCKVTGNTILRDTIKDLLGINELEATADGKYWLEYTPCFGACDISPAMRINGKVFGHLTTQESVKTVLDQFQ